MHNTVRFVDLSPNDSQTSDNMIFETMREIMKDFVLQNNVHYLDDATCLAYKNRYEEWRHQLNDVNLKAYTAFDLMEKLYNQEYLITK